MQNPSVISEPIGKRAHIWRAERTQAVRKAGKREDRKPDSLLKEKGGALRRILILTVGRGEATMGEKVDQRRAQAGPEWEGE